VTAAVERASGAKPGLGLSQARALRLDRLGALALAAGVLCALLAGEFWVLAACDLAVSQRAARVLTIVGLADSSGIRPDPDAAPAQ
jgi:hypothetical protein